VAAWFNDASIDLGDHVAKAFQEARDLSSPTTAAAKRKQKAAKPLKKGRTR
jgi:hypothetical protein